MPSASLTRPVPGGHRSVTDRSRPEATILCFALCRAGLQFVVPQSAAGSQRPSGTRIERSQTIRRMQNASEERAPAGVMSTPD